jgi:hypothetical protein
MAGLQIPFTDRSSIGDGELFRMLRELQAVHRVYPEHVRHRS